jgi:pSer/pThr/pTyr-binding forkhead associated (FHA) protein
VRARSFCRTGELAGVDHEIDDQATIGRSTQNSLQLGAAVVSQNHARIFDRSANAFVLEDLHSKNGTRLDGLPVNGSRRLGAVHVVTLGEEHDFIFVAGPTEAAPISRPVADALFAPQPLQDDPNLLLRREPPPRLPSNVSNDPFC